MKKINRNKAHYTNIALFTKEQQDQIRNTKEIRKDEYGEFAKLTTNELDELFGHAVSYDWTYFLHVYGDLKGNKIKSYDGVAIMKGNDFECDDIIKINTGDLFKDEELALAVLFEIEGEVEVGYSSTYDDFSIILEEKIEKQQKSKVIKLKDKRKEQ